jgi:hypothetical protein
VTAPFGPTTYDRAEADARSLLLVGFIASAFFLVVAFGLGLFLGMGLDSDDRPPAEVAEAVAPSTVYVLQSYYGDVAFVDGVFSSQHEAEEWMNDHHDSFVKVEGSDNTYESGSFTYVLLAHEVNPDG